FLAAKQLGVLPERCVYVGDDLRDIQAGESAGMATVAAAYGYCGEDSPPNTWGANIIIDSPVGLLKFLPA
ncbi:MAG: HAD hydrolase-like protein, partial [Burkholderiaceae bacterium]